MFWSRIALLLFCQKIILFFKCHFTNDVKFYSTIAFRFFFLFFYNWRHLTYSHVATLLCKNGCLGYFIIYFPNILSTSEVSGSFENVLLFNQLLGNSEFAIWFDNRCCIIFIMSSCHYVTKRRFYFWFDLNLYFVCTSNSENLKVRRK